MIVLVAGALVAAAAGHSGIPADGLALLGAPIFVDDPSGWVADVLDEEGGTVRVYVAPSADLAAGIFDGLLAATGRVLPVLPMGAERSVGDGHRVAVWRDDNVVASVERPSAGALELAVMLFEALEDGGGWPQAPEVRLEGGEVRVDGSWDYVAFEHPLALDPFTMKTRLVRLVPTGPQAVAHDGHMRRLGVTAWDRYGRAVHAAWEAPGEQAPADPVR